MAWKLVPAGYGMDTLRILVHFMAQLTTRGSRYRYSKKYCTYCPFMHFFWIAIHLLMIMWKSLLLSCYDIPDLYVGMDWRVFMERGT